MNKNCDEVVIGVNETQCMHIPRNNPVPSPSLSPLRQFSNTILEVSLVSIGRSGRGRPGNERESQLYYIVHF